MRDILFGALRASLVTWVLCGLAYPLALTGMAQWLLPSQANGSLETDPDGRIVGSRLIEQNWNRPQWFQGRPAATTAADREDITKGVPAPYNAADSTGSNLGPTSGRLFERSVADRASLQDAQPELSEPGSAGRHADRIRFRSRSRYQPSQCRAAGSAGRAGARRRNGGHRSTCSAPRDTSRVRDFR